MGSMGAEAPGHRGSRGSKSTEVAKTLRQLEPRANCWEKHFTFPVDRFSRPHTLGPYFVPCRPMIVLCHADPSACCILQTPDHAVLYRLVVPLPHCAMQTDNHTACIYTLQIEYININDRDLRDMYFDHRINIASTGWAGRAPQTLGGGWA